MARRRQPGRHRDPACRRHPRQYKPRVPGWRARRGVVEACHSWLNRNRALLIRWSKKEENHLALLMLAGGLIAFKKARTAALQATQAAALEAAWRDRPLPFRPAGADRSPPD